VADSRRIRREGFGRPRQRPRCVQELIVLQSQDQDSERRAVLTSNSETADLEEGRNEQRDHPNSSGPRAVDSESVFAQAVNRRRSVFRLFSVPRILFDKGPKIAERSRPNALRCLKRTGPETPLLYQVSDSRGGLRRRRKPVQLSGSGSDHLSFSSRMRTP